MSKIDRIKEELAWLRLVFTIGAAIDVSLIAWIVRNYASTQPTFAALGLIGVVLFTAVCAWANHAALSRFKTLGETQ